MRKMNHRYWEYTFSLRPVVARGLFPTRGCPGFRESSQGTFSHRNLRYASISSALRKAVRYLEFCVLHSRQRRQVDTNRVQTRHMIRIRIAIRRRDASQRGPRLR